jgi:nitrite reductase (NO-forming)
LRIAFGLIWLIDAALKWLPGFRASYMSVIMDEAQGQPGWLQPWFHFWIRFQHPDAMFLAYLAAVAEMLIAVALIAGFARKLTYLSAIAFSLLIWGTAEGFGGPYTTGASDIGTAIIYAVVFAGLLALSYYAGPARYSADYYIEQKISWWWRIAEMRRPAPVEALAPAGVTVAGEAATPQPHSALPRSA